MLDILFYIFLGITGIILLYWLVFYLNFSLKKSKEKNPKRIPISVILYAKNQMNEITKILPKILAQQYHDFEIVIVNNASTDSTLEISKEFASMYANIRVVNVANNEAFWGSKRYALTLGIKASRYEYLMFVDCDSSIPSEHWLWKISSEFTLNKTIVIGTTQYEKRKGLLNKWIRFQHTCTELHSLAFSQFFTPYSLVAKNIGYKKETFYNSRGFAGYMNEYLNEHELFLKETSTNKNTAIGTDTQTQIQIPTPINTKQWQEEKKRKILLLKRLPFSILFFHNLLALCRIAWIILACILIFSLYQTPIVASICITTLFIKWIIFCISTLRFNQKDLRIWYPIFETLSLFSIIYWIPTYLFSKSK